MFNRQGIADGQIQTYTGRFVAPLALERSDVNLFDLARSLSMICRWGGHVKDFYSVAEHSVLMARWFVAANDIGHARWALLHDAAEVYLADVTAPVKHAPALAGLVGIERQIVACIAQAFGLEGEVEPEPVRALDRRIRADEARWLCRRWVPEAFAEPLGVELHLWAPQHAESAFLSMAAQLGLAKHGAAVI